MSENKHTPEPWAYYDDRKSTGRIEIVGLGKTVSRIYLSVPDEDVANALRIVACVNACAGIDTELLEIIADNDKTLAGVIAIIEKRTIERCAVVCEQIDVESFGVLPIRAILISDHCAAAIRKLGEQ